MESVETASYAIWFLCGIILILLEVTVAPGLFVGVIFGASAVVVSILMKLGFLPEVIMQVTVFCGCAAAILVVLRVFFPQLAVGKVSSKSEDDTEDGCGIIGSKATVADDFKGSHGVVLMNGTRWNATSEDALIKGDMVTVTSYGSTCLSVEKIK